MVDLGMDKSGSNNLSIVEMSTPAEFDEASALYRRVFGYAGGEFTLNPLLMRGIIANGGTAVGVRDAAGVLVGFAYGFPGYRDGEVYQYSQAAVIDPSTQGSGVGRLLKQAQRDVALARGMKRMRWAYDPFYARNGHFNLDVLGGVGRWFHPDFYGVPGTERVVVDWDLKAPARDKAVARLPDLALTPDAWGGILRDRYGLWLPLPAGVTVDVKPLGDDLARIRSRFMASLAEVFSQGAVLTSCVRVTPETAAYLAA